MFITTQLILASFISSSVPDLDSGKKLRQEGKLEEAIVAFQEILASQPDLPEAQLELGHSLALAGQYREAIEAYESSPPRRIFAGKWNQPSGEGGLISIRRHRCLAREGREGGPARQAIG